jgi:hypothetical protein
MADDKKIPQRKFKLSPTKISEIAQTGAAR